MAFYRGNSFKILFIFLFASCSTKIPEEIKYQAILKSKDYQKALNFIEKSSEYQRENSKLLTLLEKAMLYHRLDRFQESLEYLRQAKELANQLYTISIKNKLKSFLTSDRNDTYYGEKYEISMINFYITLNNLLLAQDESNSKRKRNFLYNSRAAIVGWDSYLEDIKIEGREKAIFKDDMLAKTFGALVHNIVGTRADINISKKLLENGQQLLLKNYNAYPSYNNSYKKFIKNFKKLPKLSKKELKKNYLSQSNHYKALNSYLKGRAKLKYRPDLLILLQESLIPGKVPKNYIYNLGAVLKSKDSPAVVKIVAAIGRLVLLDFMIRELGLSANASNYNPFEYYLDVNFLFPLTNIIASINFQLPTIAKHPSYRNVYLRVKNQKGTDIYKKEIPLIAPLGDIAQQAVEESSAFKYIKTGFKVAVKYILAAAAAYKTYSSLSKSKETGGLAKHIAVVQYLAAVRLIEKAQAVDLRQWRSLPSAIRILDINLAPGNYKLSFYKSTKDGGKNLFFEKNIVISNKKNQIPKILNLQI